MHDNANAPAPLHVHVIQGPAVDQAKVVAALNNCKLCLKIDRGRFGQAVAWRKKNRAGASEVEPALPALFDDMPVGTFATTTAATAAAAGPTDIASKDPVRDAQTVFTQANASGRNAVLISTEAEALKKSGEYRGQNIVGDQLICAAGSLYPSWKPENFNDMYPTLIPWGRGGPTEPKRTKPISMASYVAHCLRLSHRSFAVHPSFTLERYSEQRLNKISAVRYNQLKCNPKIISSAISISAEEVHVAALHFDRCKKAAERNAPKPPKPATVTREAEQFLFSAQVPLAVAHGTELHAMANRHKLFAIQRMFGSFSHWSTTTPDDLNCPIHAKRANCAPDAGVKERAEAICADSAACAQAHIDIVHLFIDHFIGWDRKKQCSRPGGGLFGTFHAWGAVSEEQWRKSLHLHLLASLTGFPRTPAQLKSWMLSEDFRADVLQYMQRTQAPGPAIKPDELFNVCGAVQHTIASEPNCDVLCTEESMGGGSVDGGGDANDDDGDDLLASCAGPAVTVDSDGIPSNVPLSRIDLDAKHTHASTPDKEHEPHPNNIACDRCGHEQSTYDATLAWALVNATEEVVVSYKSGLKGFHDIEIDVVAAFKHDGSAAAETVESRQARAALILLCGQYINHRHRPSCFKDTTKKKAKSRRCRFRIPEPSRGTYAIVVNNNVQISMRTNSSFEMELDKITVVDFVAGANPLFAFTPRHNAFHMALFRCINRRSTQKNNRSYFN